MCVGFCVRILGICWGVGGGNFVWDFGVFEFVFLDGVVLGEGSVCIVSGEERLLGGGEEEEEE